MSYKEFLLVGLGNPGDQYNNNRHNIGFMVLDRLAQQWGGCFGQEKWQAVTTDIRLQSTKVHLVKPLTYMNRSGQAVSRYSSFYKMTPEQVVVVHDDLDMPPGRIKLVRGGGAGGHNGIKSIVSLIGSNDYFRLKIGIGRPGKNDVHKDFPVEKYVLSDFSSAEMLLLEERFASLEEGLQLLFLDSPSRAMNLLNALR